MISYNIISQLRNRIQSRVLDELVKSWYQLNQNVYMSIHAKILSHYQLLFLWTAKQLSDSLHSEFSSKKYRGVSLQAIIES